jgi:hypothetical protein
LAGHSRKKQPLDFRAFFNAKTSNTPKVNPFDEESTQEALQ